MSNAASHQNTARRQPRPPPSVRSEPRSHNRARRSRHVIFFRGPLPLSRTVGTPHPVEPGALGADLDRGPSPALIWREVVRARHLPGLHNVDEIVAAQAKVEADKVPAHDGLVVGPQGFD